MAIRKYIAYYDNGHDRGHFYFYSEHRANSKANIEDAYEHGRRIYGNAWKRRSVITETLLDC